MFKRLPWARQERSYDTRIIADSDCFDLEFYSSSAGIKFKSKSDAVEHYIRTGEALDMLPSHRFNPSHYRFMYADVVASGRCLLAHYVQHGRSEGRLPFVNVGEFESPGERPFTAGRPTIAIVCHELSETGAPILGWNISKCIPENWNVVSINLRGGALASFFAETSSAVFEFGMLRIDHMRGATIAELVLRTIAERFGITHIIANSAVSYPLASAGAYLGIPVTMLVHEFSEYLTRELIQTAVLMSDHVVFSSELTRNSAKDITRLDLSGSSVFPQGRSEIPPVKASAEGRQKLKRALSNAQDSKFVVIGCGHFQIRKGVDSFVSAAKRVADKLGRDQVTFIWAGNGFDPDRDHAYSIWIKDQIKRSGLEDVVHIIPGLDGSDLGQLYGRADAMFLSSRLDPYPNVAIDAISIGLPVVCFAEATGVAEHLLELEDGQQLVAPYLDVVEAADRLVQLWQNKGLRSRLKQQLRGLAKEKFSMKAYVDRILETLPLARQAASKSQTNTKTVLDAKIATLEFLCPPGSSHNMRSAVTEYVRAEEKATKSYSPAKRRLFAGHSIQEYRPSSVGARLDLPPTVRWLSAGRPPGRWARKVVDLSSLVAATDRKIKSAIHIHAHYADVLEYFVQEISGNHSRPDLYVTTSKNSAVQQIEKLLSDYDGVARILKVENRGRDLGPMLVALADTIQMYDVVGHIHTKKSFDVSDRALVEAWVRFLVANTVGSATKSLDKILWLYATNPRIGLSFPEDPNLVGWTENRDIADAMLLELGIDQPTKESIEFPIGNFFFFRPGAIRPVLSRGFRLEDFPDEPLPYDGTSLHALERLWTVLCESQGYDWITTTVPGVSR